MKKFLVVILFFLLAAVPFYGQTKITGKVTDSNGVPVVGAYIKTVSGNVSAYSKFNGFFELHGVQAGTEIEVSYYKMETVKVSAKEYMEIVMTPVGGAIGDNRQQTDNPGKSFTPENAYSSAPVATGTGQTTYVPNTSDGDYAYQPGTTAQVTQVPSKTEDSPKKTRMDILIAAQVSVPGLEPFQPAVGLEFGMAKKWGFYVRGVAPTSGYGVGSTYRLSWTDGRVTTRYWAASAGALWRVCKPLYLSLGAGYSSRSVYWGLLSDDRMYEKIEYSYSGPSFEAGFILRFGVFALSASATMGGLFNHGYSGFVGNFGAGVFF